MNSFNTFVFSLVMALTISSCIKSKPVTEEVDSIDNSASDSLVVDKLPNANRITTDPNQFCFLIYGHFDSRDTISELYQLVQQRKWQVLAYQVDERKFYLKPLELDTLSWYDECGGWDMTSIVGISKDTVLQNNLLDEGMNDAYYPSEVDYIYLSGLKRPNGEIPSYFHTQVGVVPGNPYRFDFGGKHYTLRAEGKQYEDHSTDFNDEFNVNFMGRFLNAVDGYQQYSLYLESDGIVQLLNSDMYEHTSLEILFIGDLDGDNKPDFLFETNTWYEGSEVTLYLSSKADAGELVRNMGTSGNYYAC